MSNKIKISIGDIFGFLTVEGFESCNYLDRKGIRRYAIKIKCRCKCGSESIVYRYKLLSGHTKSCGCYQKIAVSKANKKDNPVRNMREYKTWASMINRCKINNKKNERYAGRGIMVCESWLSFDNFYKDMGPKPKGKYSIERINNDGDYSPSNCKWATVLQQNRNKSNIIKVVYKGVTYPLTELCEILNLSVSKIRQRITRFGYSIEEAISKN